MECIEAVSVLDMYYKWYDGLMCLKGRYEAALRDYKKGKFMLESRPGQLVPIGSTKDGQRSAAAEQQQKRILDKVWSMVERVMGEMRDQLSAKLLEPSRSVEEQEKILECVACKWRALSLIPG